MKLWDGGDWLYPEEVIGLLMLIGFGLVVFIGAWLLS